MTAGFYARVVFPRLMDFALSKEAVRRLRREILSEVSGRVLEIGFGTGMNLPFYPPRVARIAAVDENPGMNRLARRRMRESPVKVDHYTLSAESLPFSEGSFDSVVSTWTVCSVGDVGAVLREVKRVLAPGGRFFFLEHGLSQDEGVRRWQRRLNAVNRLLAVGCEIDRDIKGLLEEGGMEIVSLERSYLEGSPRPLASMYKGIAMVRRR